MFEWVCFFDWTTGAPAPPALIPVIASIPDLRGKGKALVQIFTNPVCNILGTVV